MRKAESSNSAGPQKKPRVEDTSSSDTKVPVALIDSCIIHVYYDVDLSLLYF